MDYSIFIVSSQGLPMPNNPESDLPDEPMLQAGSCILRRPECGKSVQDALLFFEAKRYYLGAWCIMPNHVHVVFTPRPGFTVSSILHSWKSFTAKRLCKVLPQGAVVWERESFDHLIRTPADWEWFVEYIHQNPVKAGLCQAPTEWPYSSIGVRFQPIIQPFVDPKDYPFVQMQGRGDLPHLYKPGGQYFVTFRLADAVRKK
jgi:REP element-mobilizing transposase RayT